MNVEQIAVRLADALRDVGPDELAAAHRLVAEDPVLTAYADQAVSAGVEAVRRAGHNAEGRFVPVGSIPEWLVLGMSAAYVGWQTDTASVCIHNPDASKPVPVVAACWKPGLVVCAECAPWHFKLKGDARFTCDCCGTVDTETTAGRLVLAEMTFLFGTCAECRFMEMENAA